MSSFYPSRVDFAPSCFDLVRAGAQTSPPVVSFNVTVQLWGLLSSTRSDETDRLHIESALFILWYELNHFRRSVDCRDTDRRSAVVVVASSCAVEESQPAVRVAIMAQSDDTTASLADEWMTLHALTGDVMSHSKNIAELLFSP